MSTRTMFVKLSCETRMDTLGVVGRERLFTFLEFCRANRQALFGGVNGLNSLGTNIQGQVWEVVPFWGIPEMEQRSTADRIRREADCG